MNDSAKRAIAGLSVVLAAASISFHGNLREADAGVPLALFGENGELPTLAPILEKISSAVVNIAIKGRVAQENDPLLNDPFFQRFFDLPKEREVNTAGSGVVLDAREGLIVTNNHVIAHADEITVTLTDGRKLQGRRIGADPETDIALIKVPAANLTAIPLGDSDKLRVGDFVLAIGNPFQIGQTVTSGIVSGLRRNSLGIEQYEDFIQTDASINPGNSGGALVNLRGELVGINTAIVAPGGASSGIGFAIPANMVRAVTNQILKYGDIRRGRLGISIKDVSPDVVQDKKLSIHQLGAIIVNVETGSPADRAGLKIGDVVTNIGATPVRDAADLRNRIGQLRAGESVELKALRDSRVVSYRAILTEREMQAEKK